MMELVVMMRMMVQVCYDNEVDGDDGAGDDDEDEDAGVDNNNNEDGL